MICPRCDSENTEVMAEAPVDNAWVVYYCNNCCFSWRNTESDKITDPAKYKAKWKLTNEKIANMMVIPPIPPLRTT